MACLVGELCTCVFMMKKWISGQPWVNVKAKVKKDYLSVQYTSWTVIFYYKCRK